MRLLQVLREQLLRLLGALDVLPVHLPEEPHEVPVACSLRVVEVSLHRLGSLQRVIQDADEICLSPRHRGGRPPQGRSGHRPQGGPDRLRVLGSWPPSGPGTPTTSGLRGDGQPRHALDARHQAWARNNHVSLVATPRYTSYWNRIECHFWALARVRDPGLGPPRSRCSGEGDHGSDRLPERSSRRRPPPEARFQAEGGLTTH